jgi:uncharacterized SAM-binding protein YcdF (DUF218 family)
MTTLTNLHTNIASQNLASLWCRHLIVAAGALLLAGATMLALQAASPEERALFAGEGTVVGDIGD